MFDFIKLMIKKNSEYQHLLDVVTTMVIKLWQVGPKMAIAFVFDDTSK